jgi:hypothetical protein
MHGQQNVKSLQDISVTFAAQLQWT